jgi:hypothetical protein
MGVIHGWRPKLPRWPFLLVLLVAMAGGVVRYVVFAPTASGGNSLTLAGVTGQRTNFELDASAQRVLALRTSLRAACRGGAAWTASWAPTNGIQIHVIRVRASFVAVERASPTYTNGEVARIGFALRGRFTGPSTAFGTVRLVARFYRGEREINACDSLDVPWAVGSHAAARLTEVVVGRQTGSYYPAVPSLAADVSPARERFIRKIDGICVKTYDRGQWAQRIAHFHDEYFVDRAFLDFAYYSAWHAGQLRAIAAAGKPPQARALYDAWFGNFRERVSIEQEGVARYEQTHRPPVLRIAQTLASLKTHGNLLGQRFGLVRCTSNGDRTPVPVLNDGQPMPLL